MGPAASVAVQDRSVYDMIYRNHYILQGERANAIALRGENELQTSKAIREHARNETERESRYDGTDYFSA